MDMFSLFKHVKKANEDKITSELEYLILFIHVYILDEFKLEKPDEILSLADAGYRRYQIQYDIKSRRFNLNFSDRQNQMEIQLVADAYKREIAVLTASVAAKTEKFKTDSLNDEEFEKLAEEAETLFVTQCLLERIEREQARRRQQQQ